MHRNPFFNSENTIPQKEGKMAVNFVLVRRKNWKPGKTLSLCLIHFKEDDFQYRMDSKMYRNVQRYLSVDLIPS